MTATPGQLRGVSRDNKSPKDVNHIKAIRRCTLISSPLSSPVMAWNVEKNSNSGFDWARSGAAAAIKLKLRVIR